MILNSAPFNASPLNGIASASASGGGQTAVNVTHEGFGRAVAGSTRVIQVTPETFARLHADVTAIVNVAAEGAGSINVGGGGSTALINVSVETLNIFQEFVSSGSTAEIEILDTGQWGTIFSGSIKDVLVGAEGTPRARGASITDVWVLSSASGRPSNQKTAIVEVPTLSGPLITGPAEAGVDVGPQAKGTPIDGADSTIEVAASVGFSVVDGAPATAVINVLTETRGTPVGNADAAVSVIPEAGPLIPGGSDSVVEAESLGDGSVLGSADAGINVLTSSGGGPSGGVEAEVQIVMDSGGFTLSRVDAPLFRVIEVAPRRRVMFFAGDDRSLKMAGEFQKQPSEVVDYDIDMTEWFAVANDGDYISRIESIAVSPTGELVVGSDYTPQSVLLGSPAKKAKVWLSGGVDGGEYKVTVLLRTNIGRIEEVDFIVRVEET